MMLDLNKQKAALQAAYQDLGQPERLARKVSFLACFADTAFLISRLGFYSFSVSTKYTIGEKQINVLVNLVRLVMHRWLMQSQLRISWPPKVLQRQ